MENIIEKILFSQKNIEEKKEFFNLILIKTTKKEDKIKILMILIEKILQVEEQVKFSS